MPPKIIFGKLSLNMFLNTGTHSSILHLIVYILEDTAYSYWHRILFSFYYKFFCRGPNSKFLTIKLKVATQY